MKRNDQRYNLYFSHTWNYNNAIAELDSLLATGNNLQYISSSVSQSHPVHRSGDDRKLYDTIKNKMKYCDSMILMCGVYSTYSRWVNKELIACKEELNIPIIAIQRFEAGQTSVIVKQHADVIVDWDRDHIVNAIKQYRRPRL